MQQLFWVGLEHLLSAFMADGVLSFVHCACLSCVCRRCHHLVRHEQHESILISRSYGRRCRRDAGEDGNTTETEVSLFSHSFSSSWRLCFCFMLISPNCIHLKCIFIVYTIALCLLDINFIFIILLMNEKICMKCTIFAL